MERLDRSVRRSLSASGVPDAGQLAEVTRVWPEAVGAAIARAAWPQRMARDGTLHVTTVSSTWAFELGRMEADVRAKLTLLIGPAAPAALRFAPGPVPEPAGPAASAERPPAPSAEDVSAATAITAGIEDPELREAVRRAVSASLARDRGGRPV